MGRDNSPGIRVYFKGWRSMGRGWTRSLRSLEDWELDRVLVEVANELERRRPGGRYGGVVRWLELWTTWRRSVLDWRGRDGGE